MQTIKYLLHDDDLPRHYLNILPLLPQALAPPLDPQTREPLDPGKMEAIFPMGLIEQEVSVQAEIPIPDEVRDVYALYRATPLIRARRLEKALGTPARIYYKNEGASPAGSHKLNTAIAQAYYNKQAGIGRLVTETGAGQWGTALSMAGTFLGLDVVVYMVRVSFDQKPYRRAVVETFGGDICASPSDKTQIGKRIRAEKPDTSGSLGMAISEAIEDAVGTPGSKYALGSVLNHVILHQTVIGLEAQKQMELAGDYPDVVIGCHGGGSNFAGIVLPFLRDKLNGRDVRFVAAEPRSCPTLTEGEFRYDFGDTGGMTPLLKMYTLGCDFVPPSIHAGGLRYHGAAPIVSHLLHHGLIEATALGQKEVFDAALTFARAEGVIPAPESAHAIRAAIVEAERAKLEGRERVILFNLSGHGHFDMAAYSRYLEGGMED